MLNSNLLSIFLISLKTLVVLKEIQKVHRGCEGKSFFFTPYPGTDLYEYIVSKGYRVPRSLSEWSDIDFIMYSGYWVGKEEREYVERFKFYAKIATELRSPRILSAPVRGLAQERVKRDFYKLPVEKEIIDRKSTRLNSSH